MHRRHLRARRRVWLVLRFVSMSQQRPPRGRHSSACWCAPSVAVDPSGTGPTSRRLLTHLATPQSPPRRPSPIPRRCCHPCPRSELSPMYPVRTPLTRPPIFQLISSFPIFSFFHPHPALLMRSLRPRPPRRISEVPPSFPSTPSSHRCEGVDGKVGGAVRAAAETGWARAEGCDLPDEWLLECARHRARQTARQCARFRSVFLGVFLSQFKSHFEGSKNLSRNRLRERSFGLRGPVVASGVSRRVTVTCSGNFGPAEA